MEFKYGKDLIHFELPQHVTWQILDRETPGYSSSQSYLILQNAIDNLLDNLGRHISGYGKKILVVIPDHTRRCRINDILPLLLPPIEREFAPDLQILLANGSHALLPETVVEGLVGKDILSKYEILQHDCTEAERLAYFGETSYGTPIYLNKAVQEADCVITVGGVLYHYFAGFGGGPKMLMPGVAGLDTIRANHRLTLNPENGKFHKECFEGNIRTNPVFLDLAQIVQFVPNWLSLQLVLHMEAEFIFAESGPVLSVHEKACKKVSEIFGLSIQKKADVVLASCGGFPADVNLIQSHKSIHHAYQAVKPGGHVIVMAECSEGVGSKSFLPFIEAGSTEDIAKKLLDDYQINGHTALALKTKTENAHIIFISDLDDTIVKQTGMIPARDIHSVWDLVDDRLPKDAMGICIRNASAYVPVS